MGGARRILFVPQSPLSASAESFLNRESIVVTSATSIEATSAGDEIDLVILDTGDSPSQASFAAAASRFNAQILGIGTSRPPDDVLDIAQAFLVAPYTQGELIGAIGDLLGTRLRRALRMGVELPATISRGDEDSTTIAATLLQVSETGCLLEADSPVRVGETIGVSFVLPSNRERISIDAMIVSTNELQLLYGLKWGTGFESQRLAILVFVELGLAKGASSAPRGDDSLSARATATSPEVVPQRG